MTDAIVNGLYSGVIYALIALGLTIIFQPTRVMNFAQGEALVLGALVPYQVVSIWGWGCPAAIALTLLAAIILGLVMERMIMLPVRLSGSRFAWIIATLAAALIFQSVYTLMYFSVDSFRPVPLAQGSLSLGGFTIGWQQLLTIIAALVIVFAYDRFLSATTYGRATRAAARQPSGRSSLSACGPCGRCNRSSARSIGVGAREGCGKSEACKRLQRRRRPYNRAAGPSRALYRAVRPDERYCRRGKRIWTGCSAPLA